MLRSVLALCGAALLVGGCEARAQDASSASPGVPEIVTRCIDGRDVEGQVASCTRAIEARAGSPELQALAYHVRAMAYCEAGRPDLSIADEDQAIALFPNFPQAYAHRGNCRLSTGDGRAAQADYDQALRLAPDVPGYYQEAAEVDNWVGDHDRALRRLDQLIRMKPDYNTAVDLRAKTLFNLGRYDEAAAGFAQAVKMFPGDAPVVLWLHLARMRAGQPDAAEFAANTAALRLSGAWPKPIVDYYAGRADYAAVMQAGKATNDEDGECQASLFIAEHMLAKGDKDLAASFFGGAVATCDPGRASNSYLAAWAELKKLNPEMKRMGPW